ncbi:hypothetical protein ACTVZO_17605 [Streptomyces sp. IBSNAI002]|uniref:hypothetical protein n=1 Tax=Streptomyces sp. IBSNAI002 TaxID=3457500 RepID=UPI003FD396B2
MSRETRIRAAAGAMRAAMEAGHGTLDELAESLEDCCLLQSPETAAARAPRIVQPPAALAERHTVALDVDEESPAADLALRLRMSQPDVTHTDVRSATEVRITVRPQSADCLRWWLGRFEADPASRTYAEGAYTVRGHRGDVTVALTIVGDDVDTWLGARHGS